MSKTTAPPKPKYLLDVNVLVALTDEDHIQHRVVTKWFDASGNHDWGMCAFTKTSFLRVTTNPKGGGHTAEEGASMLASLAQHPGYRFWPGSDEWTTAVTPFFAQLFKRLLGYQQLTDAYLLGLALREGGILVTTDKTIRYLAGTRYGHWVCVLHAGARRTTLGAVIGELIRKVQAGPRCPAGSSAIKTAANGLPVFASRGRKLTPEIVNDAQKDGVAQEEVESGLRRLGWGMTSWVRKKAGSSLPSE
jgi:hypothetical protein